MVQKLILVISLNIFEDTSVYKISYKTPTGSKPLHVRFDKLNRFIIALDVKIKHLVVFNYELLKKICDKIKYLTSKKIGIQVVLITNLERLELIRIILYLLQKC